MSEIRAGAGDVVARGEARLAGRISDWCEPRNWMLCATPLLGWHADGPAGCGWGLVAAVFTGVIPPLLITAGERRELWGVRLRRRADRLAAAPWIVASVAVGTALLYLLGAPAPVPAVPAAMLAVLLALAAITTVWKVSAHSAVAAGVSAILMLTYGSWTLPLAAVTTATAWSRIRLGRHTPAQAVVGVTVGAVVGGLVFALLR
ncbi:hypothetical protein [Streptomyces katsurahamanus]|uniref:Phosphatase PAP2 family protein n=1 Tax=Streptomyces katsurahamanus TaxID=2577098 RepID=A0ABW9NV13_9ACTN|nr:hypothetical protein [Streptomyces katsurahamanus]MQS37093.1 hypothetical protein [Streptomyces katsurahamanus]